MTTFTLSLTTPRSAQATAAQVAQISAVQIPPGALLKALVGAPLTDSTAVSGTNVVRTLTFQPLPRTISVLCNRPGIWNGIPWGTLPEPPDLTQPFTQVTNALTGQTTTFPPMIKVIEIPGQVRVSVSLAPIASPAVWSDGNQTAPAPGGPQDILQGSLLTVPRSGNPLSQGKPTGYQPVLVTATWSSDGTVVITFLKTITVNDVTGQTPFVEGSTLTLAPGATNPNFLVTLQQTDTRVALVALQAFGIGNQSKENGSQTFLPGQTLPSPPMPGTTGLVPQAEVPVTQIVNVTLQQLAEPAFVGGVPVPPSTLISQPTTTPALPQLVQGIPTVNGLQLVVLQTFTTRNGTVTYTAGQVLTNPPPGDFAIQQTRVQSPPQPPKPIPGLVVDVVDPQASFWNPNAQATLLLGHYRPAIELLATQRNVVETVTAAATP